MNRSIHDLMGRQDGLEKEKFKLITEISRLSDEKMEAIRLKEDFERQASALRSQVQSIQDQQPGIRRPSHVVIRSENSSSLKIHEL